MLRVLGSRVSSDGGAGSFGIIDQLVSVLSMVEVTVVDHLVVGDGDCVSFVDLGLL